MILIAHRWQGGVSKETYTRNSLHWLTSQYTTSNLEQRNVSSGRETLDKHHFFVSRSQSWAYNYYCGHFSFTMCMLWTTVVQNYGKEIHGVVPIKKKNCTHNKNNLVCCSIAYEMCTDTRSLWQVVNISYSSLIQEAHCAWWVLMNTSIPVSFH